MSSSDETAGLTAGAARLDDSGGNTCLRTSPTEHWVDMKGCAAADAAAEIGCIVCDDGSASDGMQNSACLYLP